MFANLFKKQDHREDDETLVDTATWEIEVSMAANERLHEKFVNLLGRILRPDPNEGEEQHD